MANDDCWGISEASVPVHSLECQCRLYPTDWCPFRLPASRCLSLFPQYAHIVMLGSLPVTGPRRPAFNGADAALCASVCQWGRRTTNPSQSSHLLVAHQRQWPFLCIQPTGGLGDGGKEPVGNFASPLVDRLPCWWGKVSTLHMLSHINLTARPGTLTLVRSCQSQPVAPKYQLSTAL